MKNFITFIAITLLYCSSLFCQQDTTLWWSNLYPKTLEDTLKPMKIAHAEPLYIDLIRDLGARKGEREWNVGLGLTDNLNYDAYTALVEYEWAIADRVGLEIEVPVTTYSSNSLSTEPTPSNRVESIKLAGQWSFMVNPQSRTSLALGYINEFEFVDLDKIASGNIFQENIFNPFFIAAQRIGNNWHSLIYTGPNWSLGLKDGHLTKGYETHVSLHYMIPHTTNFVGVETNMNWEGKDFIAVIRPQMRVNITEEIKTGLVVGVPLMKTDERLSFFIRLIWEPQV